MILPLVTYKNILADARNFFVAAGSGNAEKAQEYSDIFFKKANKIDASLARMSLQQGSCDVLGLYTKAMFENKITKNDLKTVRNNIKKTNMQLNKSQNLYDLEKRVKENHKSTGQKRLAIISCLLDSEDLGLAKVKNFKMMKRFQFLVRKILRR